MPGGLSALAQVHCHQHAVLGWDADKDLLDEAGVAVEQLDSGCCGLAGNFGFEAGHLEVSEACAERVLLPKVRDADQAALLLADGFSCRTQVHDLDSAGREAVHVAEVLAAAVRHETVPSGQTPESAYARRPPAPGTAAKIAALAGAGAVAAAGVAAAVALARRVT